MLTNSQTLLEAVGASGSTVLVVASVMVVLWVTGIAWAVQQERETRRLDAEAVELEPTVG